MRHTLTLLAALLLAPLVALHAADSSKSTSNAAPPEYMKTLPADYLPRLRHALQLEAEKFDNPQFKKANVIKVRVGIAGWPLGRHVDELNAYFEADSFGWKPSEKWGSAFSLHPIYAYTHCITTGQA